MIRNTTSNRSMGTGGRSSNLALAVLLVVPFFLACHRPDAAKGSGSSEPDSVLASIVDAQVVNRGQEIDQAGSRPTSPRLAPEDQVARPLSIREMGYNVGSPDAPIKILEISDFGCGVCRRFHEETYPDILRVYVDEGFVEWKYIPFVLGRFPNGLQAAIAGECAGEQDQFSPMQKRLFDEQPGWRNSDDPYAYFSRLAAEEELDVERFDSCVSGGWREDRVRANIRLAQQVGASGTPYFVIDGIAVPGAIGFDDFGALIDSGLLQRGITPPGR